MNQLPSVPPIISLAPLNLFSSKILIEYLQFKVHWKCRWRQRQLITGVVYTSAKLTADDTGGYICLKIYIDGSDTGGKFTTNVNNASSKLPPVSTTPAVINNEIRLPTA
jgi:hypothetical protein